VILDSRWVKMSKKAKLSEIDKPFWLISRGAPGLEKKTWDRFFFGQFCWSMQLRRYVTTGYFKGV
jgi:hypothetical protein